MKFLVDAQLPRRMCHWLADGGHDALHTLDLPLGNATPDEALIDQADAEGRVLVTKDDDFVQSRLVRGRPRLRASPRSGSRLAPRWKPWNC